MKLLAIALALASLPACAGSAAPENPARPRVIAASENGPLTFEVEVAATPDQRARGLMFRESVPPGTGMLFLFPAASRGGFWMKNTLVPLDIAFINGDRVVEVRAMTPCEADPCPLTTPSRDYDRALETAAGELDGVEPGAAVTVEGVLPIPV